MRSDSLPCFDGCFLMRRQNGTARLRVPGTQHFLSNVPDGWMEEAVLWFWVAIELQELDRNYPNVISQERKSWANSCISGNVTSPNDVPTGAGRCEVICRQKSAVVNLIANQQADAQVRSEKQQVVQQQAVLRRAQEGAERAKQRESASADRIAEARKASTAQMPIAQAPPAFQSVGDILACWMQDRRILQGQIRRSRGGSDRRLLELRLAALVEAQYVLVGLLPPGQRSDGGFGNPPVPVDPGVSCPMSPQEVLLIATSYVQEAYERWRLMTPGSQTEEALTKGIETSRPKSDHLSTHHDWGLVEQGGFDQGSGYGGHGGHSSPDFFDHWVEYHYADGTVLRTRVARHVRKSSQ